MHATAPIPAAQLRAGDIGAEVRLSGWCHRIRDHGGVLFIDLRDHYGLTQVVADPDSPAFKIAETLRSEWVVRVDGKVRRRPDGTDNPELPTGAVEIYVREIEVLGPAAELPMPVFGDQEYPEDIRLKYRFLDLRRERLHNNIMLRGQIINSIRRRMKEQGFFEFQTPILTASSPEGARDYPGAVAAASGKVLRAAAGAAAVQAADHGVGLRPLFPDRALLPRRGRARRPLAGRILSARSGNEFRHPGRRVRRCRAGDPRRVRGVCRRQAGDEGHFRAFPTARRSRKYGSDKPDLRNPIVMAERVGAFSAAPASRFSRAFSKAAPRPRCGRSRRRAAARAPSATA